MSLAPVNLRRGTNPLTTPWLERHSASELERFPASLALGPAKGESLDLFQISTRFGKSLAPLLARMGTGAFDARRRENPGDQTRELVKLEWLLEPPVADVCQVFG
jgi:hypothetical protein